MELDQAARFLATGQWADALANLNRSHYTLGNILLEARGKKPRSDYESACELRAHVIDRGFASELWNEIHETLETLLETPHPDEEPLRGVLKRSLDLLEESRTTLVLLSNLARRGAGEKIG